MYDSGSNVCKNGNVYLAQLLDGRLDEGESSSSDLCIDFEPWRDMIKQLYSNEDGTTSNPSEHIHIICSFSLFIRSLFKDYRMYLFSCEWVCGEKGVRNSLVFRSAKLKIRIDARKWHPTVLSTVEGGRLEVRGSPRATEVRYSCRFSSRLPSRHKYQTK